MDYNQIKDFIRQIGNSNVEEVNLEFPDGIKISVKKSNVPGKEVVQEEEKEISNVEYKLITSPMVGTFYSKAEPNASPFVKVGDKVTKGQTLCILEAMKLMNEIESEYEGEIAEICVKDKEMVEFGQVLFKIK